MGSPYPVRVRARLDHPNRGLWLVKWLLLIPHSVVLVLLWIAATVLTVVAFFAILLTGRYPRSIFDFNVGVLRWTWRVWFYGYGALGTDRYPPFTLDELPDYPAGLEVDHPERLSRGLVLVKSWLLAIPHYLVLAFFAGGGLYVVSGSDSRDWTWGGGLITLLVLFAGVVLLFTRRYPRPVFDLVLGMDRWLLRVAGYALLMTDEYPPFRLDMGSEEPGGPAPAEHPAPVAIHPAREPPRPGGSGWTGGRIVSLVAGSLAVMVALGAGVAGAGLAFVDTSLRDDDDFLMSSPVQFGTSSYAVSTNNLQMHSDSGAGSVPRLLIGKVKITADAGADSPVFVGIGRTEDVDDYLDGVAQAVVVDLDGDSGDLVPEYDEVSGTAPATPPDDADMWAAQASGTGEQTLIWKAQGGDWTVVLMNADASAGVDADVAAGATVPVLGWGVAVLLTVAAVFLFLGVLLLVLTVRRAHVPAGSAPPLVPTG